MFEVILILFCSICSVTFHFIILQLVWRSTNEFVHLILASIIIKGYTCSENVEFLFRHTHMAYIWFT